MPYMWAEPLGNGAYAYRVHHSWDGEIRMFPTAREAVLYMNTVLQNV